MGSKSSRQDPTCSDMTVRTASFNFGTFPTNPHLTLGREGLLYLQRGNSLGLRRQHSARPQGWAGDPSPSLSLSSIFSFLGPSQNMPLGHSRTLDTSANPWGFTSLNCTRRLGLVFLPTLCYLLFILNLVYSVEWEVMGFSGCQLTDGRHSPEEAVSIAGLQKAHAVCHEPGWTLLHKFCLKAIS